MGERLASLVKELTSDEELALRIGALRCADSDEARETAKVVADCLEPTLQISPAPLCELNPDYNPAHRGSRNRVRELASILTEDDGAPPGSCNATLVVGHQPQLSWLTQIICGEALPLVHSELLCIALKDTGRRPLSRGNLRWVLSPSDNKAIVELKEKIRSKMETAKQLSAFILAALGFLLASLIDEDKMEYLNDHAWAMQVSAALFLIGAVLFVATLYAYDRLLMPTRFWADAMPLENPRRRPKWLVWRPPSSALWVLYQNMMRIWRTLFSGAVYSKIGGFLFLTYAVFKPSPVVFVALSALGVLGLRSIYRYFGPHLGTED